MTGTTIYSDTIKGERCNYGQDVRFDMTDGVLGITQFDDEAVRDRVLLSQKQLKALEAFIKASKRSR